MSDEIQERIRRGQEQGRQHRESIHFDPQAAVVAAQGMANRLQEEILGELKAILPDFEPLVGPMGTSVSHRQFALTNGGFRLQFHVKVPWTRNPVAEISAVAHYNGHKEEVKTGSEPIDYDALKGRILNLAERMGRYF